ncbi:MAG: 2'-5' RNA ligase family protein, partial [bacterium]|nr:2'-5' RNA ligase family protein [bacterium]
MNYEYHNPLLRDRRSRLYAVVLYLPDYLDAMARGLREKYDPDYNIVDSHVTVVFPFESDRPVNELASAISTIADKREPFEIVLDNLADFYPRSPIIYWSLQESEPL